MSRLCPRLSKNDVLHLKELSYRYYPDSIQTDINYNKAIQLSLNSTLETFDVSKNLDKPLITNQGNKLNLKPASVQYIERKYLCCDLKTTNFKESVDHWIETHHLPSLTDTRTLTTTQHGSLPRIKINELQCNSLADLGNPDYPLFERASYFLHQIKTVPSSSHLFKPYCQIINPHKMSNPYSAALTIAYDFIEVISTQRPEYRYFLARLLKHKTIQDYSGTLRDHLPYFVFWSGYFYPNYLKKQAPQISYSQAQMFSLNTFKSNKEPRYNSTSFKNFRPVRTLHTNGNTLDFRSNNGLIRTLSQEESQSLFRCKNPGCNKIYKQLNGLRYHMEPGRCLVISQNNSNNSCPFKPCERSLNSLEGLKIHIKKHHLVSNSSSETIDLFQTYNCTLCTIHSNKYKTYQELRDHIKENHKLSPMM